MKGIPIKQPIEWKVRGFFRGLHDVCMDSYSMGGGPERIRAKVSVM